MVLRFGDDTASHNRGGDRQRRGSQARSPGQRRLVRQMGAGHGEVRPPLPKPSATMAQQAQRTAGEREELFRVVYRQASRKRSSQDYKFTIDAFFTLLQPLFSITIHEHASYGHESRTLPIQVSFYYSICSLSLRQKYLCFKNTQKRIS